MMLKEKATGQYLPSKSRSNNNTRETYCKGKRGKEHHCCIDGSSSTSQKWTRRKSNTVGRERDGHIIKLLALKLCTMVIVIDCAENKILTLGGPPNGRDCIATETSTL